MADLCLHSNGVLSGIRARFSLLDREVAVFRPVELSLALDSRIHYRILSKISKPLRQRRLVQSESNVDGVPLHPCTTKKSHSDHSCTTETSSLGRTTQRTEAETQQSKVGNNCGRNMCHA